MKKVIFGAIIGLLAVASTASATALTQKQIDSLLGLLRSFGADATMVAKVESALTEKPTTPATDVWCHTFNRNLKIGDRSSDVTSLHIALQKSSFSMNAHELAGHNSDYGDFGESTASAVTAFQEKYRSEILTPSGLSHGTGYVGKSTRAKLNMLYGCTRPPVGSKTIDVKTPSTFTLTPDMSARVVNHRDMTITLKQIVQTKIVCITAPCVSPLHALVSIDVPGGCGPNADPRCLGAPSFHQDYNLRKGETVDVMGLPIELSEISESKATIKIGKGNSTANQPPVIKGVKGPTQLGIGEAGTWTIEAYDPERASLRYSVTWGDENNYVSPSSPSGREGATNAQTTTLTHSYTRVGSYTVQMTVSDNAGQEAKSSMTVQVGEKADNGSLYLRPDALNLKVGDTQGIAAYFQPPMPPCPVGRACIQVMPASYRVDARFVIDDTRVADLSFAIPMCIQSEIADNYCGTQVSVSAKAVGSAKITATWNGLSASMSVNVTQ